MCRPTLLAVLAFAAPTLAQQPATPVEDLFPLAVGNVWTYKVAGQDDRFVVRAVRQEMVGSQTCVRLEGSLKDRVVATEHVAFTKDGLCRFRVDREALDQPVCILKQVSRRAPSWKAAYQLGGRPAAANFTRSSGGEVTVPAGKYRTVTVQADIDGTWTRSKVWYAAGVGPVKQTIEEGKRPQVVLELEKFEKGEGE
jgi:hypothetical protein